MVSFDPALPAAKRAAINRLGYGVLNKVVVYFEAPFWPLEQYAFGCVGHLTEASPTCLISLWKSHRVPALMMCVGGALGNAIEGWSRSAVRDWTMDLLRDTFGAATPEPVRVERTAWGSDPFARGSYSYIAVGSTPEDLDILAEPVGQHLFFAGEATTRQHWATAQSAYVSGLREAARIARRPGLLPPRHFTENRRWRAMTQRANRFINLRGQTIPRPVIDDRLAVLRLNPVFGVVPRSELEVLAAMFDVRAFAHGDRICSLGERATNVYVIASGSVRVEVPGQADFVQLERGQDFGEYGLFGSHIRSATVIAHGKTVALVLDYQRFERFLLAFPESMKVLLDATVQHLLATEIRAAERTRQ